MALLFLDSCDHYSSTEVDQKWTSKSGSVDVGAYGRNSTNGLRFGPIGVGLDLVWRGFTAMATGTFGFALKPTLNQTSGLCCIFDASANNTQIQIFLATDGTLSVYRAFGNGVTTAAPFAPTGNTLLGSSAGGVVTANNWHYIEIQFTIHDTTGAVTIHVNTNEVLALTDVDTQATANASASSICIGKSETTTHDIDDVYILDATGGVNDTFLGDVRVDAILPNGAGATTGWTPSAGANYACVDESSPNSDTDYVSTETADAVDTYVFPNLTNAGSVINGLQVLAYCKKEDVGACSIAPVVRPGSTDRVGTTTALGTAYGYHVRQVYDVSPETSTTWTETEFNASEFGVKKIV